MRHPGFRHEHINPLLQAAAAPGQASCLSTTPSVESFVICPAMFKSYRRRRCCCWYCSPVSHNRLATIGTMKQGSPLASSVWSSSPSSWRMAALCPTTTSSRSASFLFFSFWPLVDNSDDLAGAVKLITRTFKMRRRRYRRRRSDLTGRGETH